MVTSSPRPQRLWAHQRAAVTAAVRLIIETGRVSVVMACSTGKTRVQAEVARRVAPEGVVLVLVPTLALLEQTAQMWSGVGRRTGVMIALCSADDALEEIHNLGDGITGSLVVQDIQLFAQEVALARRHGAVTVFCTYQSLWKIARAHQDFDLARWDLIVVDEAHRVTGATRRGEEKAWMQVHRDAVIPALRRLYLTATPKILDSTAKPGAKTIISMDNEEIFGPIVYRLDHAEAADKGLVAHFDVAVSAVTRADLHTILGTDPATWARRVDNPHLGPRMVATQVAVARAIKELGVRRVIVYFNSVDAAKAFADEFPNTMALLPARARPKVWIEAISGRETTRERRTALATFTDPPLGTEAAIICNAKVLAEGVSIDDVDCIVFADHRSSVTDVTQAVGRSTRKPAGREKRSWVVLPVYLPVTDREDGAQGGVDTQDWELVLERSSYRRVARTLDALVAHGARIPLFPRDFAASSPGKRPLKMEPEHVIDTGRWIRVVQSAQGTLSRKINRALRLQILNPRTRDWRRWLEAVERFHTAYHHLDVPADYTRDASPFGTTLRDWLDYCRQRKRDGLLDAVLVQELEAFGMIWNEHDHAWQVLRGHAQAWAKRRGNLLHEADDTDGTYPLALRLAAKRQKAKQGTLDPQHAATLDALDPLWRWPLPWQKGARHLESYAASGKDTQKITARTEHADFGIGSWLRKQLKAWDTLHPAQRAWLQELGVQPPAPVTE